MKQQITDYDSIRDTLDNGDLVLFKGKGIISLLIRWFCSLVNGFKITKYSHIGFIVRDSGRVLLCDSTTQTYDDTVTCTDSGVRLVPLSQILILYSGEIYIRRLEMAREDYDIRSMTSYINVNIHKPYEKHLIELMESAKKDDWKNTNNNSDFFCSELVAGLYLLWRLIRHSKNSYSPDEFRAGGLVDDEMKTSIRKAKLLSEVRLK